MLNVKQLNTYEPADHVTTHNASQTKGLGRKYNPLLMLFNRESLGIPNGPISIGIMGDADIGKSELVEGLLEGVERSYDPKHIIHQQNLTFPKMNGIDVDKDVEVEFFFTSSHGWVLKYDAGLDDETLLEMEAMDGFEPFEMDLLRTQFSRQPSVEIIEHPNRLASDRQRFDIIFACAAENKDPNGSHTLHTKVYIRPELQAQLNALTMNG